MVSLATYLQSSEPDVWRNPSDELFYSAQAASVFLFGLALLVSHKPYLGITFLCLGVASFALSLGYQFSSFDVKNDTPGSALTN